MGAHDLNFKINICDPFGLGKPGVMHECGQDAVFTNDGVRTARNLWTLSNGLIRRI